MIPAAAARIFQAIARAAVRGGHGHHSGKPISAGVGIGVLIETAAFERKMSRLIREFPRAVADVLNESAFEVRRGWRDELPSVFDRPTPLTLNAPLYKKATPSSLVAEVYIRDEATKGTPPVQYLAHHVFGGPRPQKRFERSLQRYAGLPGFMTPARGAPLDQFGNLKRGTVTKILSQLQASADQTQRETAITRARRLRKQRRRGGGGSYFTLPANRGKLKSGRVYERISTGFGSAVRPILLGADASATYKKRFDPHGIAQQLFARRFEVNMRRVLARLEGNR